jgi:hypothetical protein
MADPVTLLVAGSTVLGAAGQISAGKAAEQEGRANQQIAERNAIKAEQDAQAAIELGKRNVAIFERDFNAYQSKTTSAYLKSGVRLDGTPLVVLENMYAEAELEKEIIKYNAKVDSADKIETAEIERMQGAAALARGKNAKRASYFNAGSTLLGGAAKAASV